MGTSILVTSERVITSKRLHTMKKISGGFFVCVEGIDGSGKSVFSHDLAHTLTERGYSVVLTREPGGTPLGERIRDLLFDKKTPPCAKSEFLLFAASRAQHCQDLIQPALTQGSVVISDRMADSSLVYQGYVRGLSLELIRSVNAWAMGTVTPRILFYLKVDAATAFARVTSRKIAPSDFETSIVPLQKAIDGFNAVFAGNPHVITLDATQKQEQVLQQGVAAIDALFASSRDL